MKQFLSVGVELLAVGTPELDIEHFRTKAYQTLWFWENQRSKRIGQNMKRIGQNIGMISYAYEPKSVADEVRYRRFFLTTTTSCVNRTGGFGITLEDNPIGAPRSPKTGS